MDVNELRSLITALCLLCFCGIAWWAYSARNRARFDDAAQLPFADDDLAQASRLNRPPHND